MPLWRPLKRAAEGLDFKNGDLTRKLANKLHRFEDRIRVSRKCASIAESRSGLQYSLVTSLEIREAFPNEGSCYLRRT